jgi:hypothetical protein
MASSLAEARMSVHKVKVYDRFGRRVGSGTIRDSDDDFGMWVFFGTIAAVVALVGVAVWGVIWLGQGVYHLVTEGQFVQSEAGLKGLDPETYIGEVWYESGRLQNPFYTSQSSETAWFTVPVTNDSGQPHDVELSPGTAEIRAHHTSLAEPEVAVAQFPCGSWDGSMAIGPHSTKEFICSVDGYVGYDRIEIVAVHEMPKLLSVN